MHAVVTAVGLKYTSHRRRRRVGEHGVNEKALSSIRLQRYTRTDCAQFHLFGTRPVSWTPLVYQPPGNRCLRSLIEFNQGNPVLSRVLDFGQDAVVLRIPGLHLDRAIIKHKDCRQTRLERTEHNAVLHETVVAAMVFHSKLAGFERSVRAFKPPRECGYGLTDRPRANHASRNQRGNRCNTVRTRKFGVLHSGLDVFGPLDGRMLRPQRITQIEAVEVKGDQVAEGRSLDAVEGVDHRFVALQESSIDELRFDETNVNVGITACGIPRSGCHPVMDIFQGDPESARSQNPTSIFRIDECGNRSILCFTPASSCAAWTATIR